MAPSTTTSESDSESEPLDPTLASHLELFNFDSNTRVQDEICTTPLFTQRVRQHIAEVGAPDPFTQRGLLAAIGRPTKNWQDPRLFYNVSAPASVFICGSQGSGKSHTLSCLLENCLLPSVANTLPHPLTGLLFHYDEFSTGSQAAPCEAAYLASSTGVEVRVVCSPTNFWYIQNVYAQFPAVTVHPLYLDQTDLNTKRMFDLMSVGSSEDSVPLYMNVIAKILRQMRLEQPLHGDFDYTLFKSRLAESCLLTSQKGPLEQRLDVLESFMRPMVVLSKKAKKAKKAAVQKNTFWEPRASQLTIVDLSCPCIQPDTACALFNVCLGLFLEQSTNIGRVVALDEAHKYMTDSQESKILTNSLLSSIRLQRHLAARVFISTQEPTVSSKLLDLCSMTIVHRFTSPAWLAELHQHLAGASKEAGKNSANKAPRLESCGLPRSAIVERDQMFAEIVSLHAGEALLFCPSAAVAVGLVGDCHDNSSFDLLLAGEVDSQEKSHGSENDDSASDDDANEIVRLGHGVVKVRIRQRVTADGGVSLMAN